VARNEEIGGSVRSLHGELDQLFAELWAGPRRRRATVQAAADVYLTEDPPTLTVQLDLAGVDPEGLRIVLDGDLLVIAGARSRPAGERRVYQHAEIDWGPFERRLRLGVAVDAEAVTASYDRGLLTIALPLAPRARRSRVPITVRGT
jgi:HSP20 family protein